MYGHNCYIKYVKLNLPNKRQNKQNNYVPSPPPQKKVGAYSNLFFSAPDCVSDSLQIINQESIRGLIGIGHWCP